MTVSLRALFLASAVAFALFLRQIQGQNYTSDNENVTSVESFTTSWTAAFVESSSTSTTSDIPQSNTTINGTVEGGTLFFNSTNGTSVPLVVPTSAPAAGSTGGGGQRFDVASFIGGIILAAGVIGLGVFIVKVYQSRQSEYSNI